MTNIGAGPAHQPPAPGTDQLAAAGKLMKATSLIVGMVSRDMYLDRWTARMISDQAQIWVIHLTSAIPDTSKSAAVSAAYAEVSPESEPVSYLRLSPDATDEGQCGELEYQSRSNHWRFRPRSLVWHP